MKNSKNTMLAILLGIGVITMSSGCKDATMAQFQSLGSRHKITLYSGGKVVGTWISTGNVSNESQSDGWYFEDESTHLLVEVAGTMTIEQIK